MRSIFGNSFIFYALLKVLIESFYFLLGIGFCFGLDFGFGFCFGFGLDFRLEFGCDNFSFCF